MKCKRNAKFLYAVESLAQRTMLCSFTIPWLLSLAVLCFKCPKKLGVASYSPALQMHIFVHKINQHSDFAPGSETQMQWELASQDLGDKQQNEAGCEVGGEEG